MKRQPEQDKQERETKIAGLSIEIYRKELELQEARTNDEFVIIYQILQNLVAARRKSIETYLRLYRDDHATPQAP